MKYKIENELLLVEIESFGAELQRMCAKKDNHEYIWTGDPTIWKGRAPVLFPIVGVLAQNMYLYKNKKYTMKKHGFARDTEFELATQNENVLELFFSDCEKTFEIFPFHFRFNVRFALEGAKLTVSHTVTNTGLEEMWFSLGAHPAFRCDLGDKLVFEKEDTIGAFRLENNLLTEKKEPFTEQTDTWYIKADSFDKDAVILEDFPSKTVMLERQEGHNIQFDFNAPYLGIWAKPGAPYVCLEPWFGLDDTPTHNGDFTQKKGIERLDAGKSLTLTYVVEVTT